MSIESLVDELDDMIEDAWTLPLSGGKSVLDADKVKRILEDIRLRFPKEMRQAKAIVADRNKIIEDSKKEAEKIIRAAEEKSKLVVDRSEMVKEAQAKANNIISDAQKKAKEMIKASNEYVDDLMFRVDKSLTENLNEIKKARKSLKSIQKLYSKNRINFKNFLIFCRFLNDFINLCI